MLFFVKKTNLMKVNSIPIVMTEQKKVVFCNIRVSFVTVTKTE